MIKQPNGPNTLPLTITRRTLKHDIAVCGQGPGFEQFELKQVFSRNVADGSFTVKMTMRNIGTRTTSNGRFCRYTDMHVVDPVTGKFASLFLTTNNSIVAATKASRRGRWQHRSLRYGDVESGLF